MLQVTQNPRLLSLNHYINYLIPTVLCGDFNTVVNPIKDRSGCNSETRSV
jgi:hypothetical protein